VATLAGREYRRVIKEWLETILAPAFSTLLYLAVFAFALGPARGSDEGAAILTFIVPGLVLYAILTRAVETTVYAILHDKLGGMIADILMAPLSASEITAAYALAGTAAGLTTGVPVLLAALLVFDLPVPEPLAALAFALLASLMMALLGVVAGLWSRKWDHVAAVLGFLIIPLTFFSGVFAPVSLLPEPVALAVGANPIFYAIDGFRGALLGTADTPAALGLAVLAATDVLLWAAAHRLIASGYRLKA
jgi:ABC-2 type transport system permease protein